MAVINIDITDRKEQRNFGLVMAGALFVIGMLRWWLHGFTPQGVPYILWTLAVPFLVLGLVWPRALHGPFYWWIQLAEVLNWIMTRVFLGIIFFFILTPIGLFTRWFGEDPIKRKWLAKEQSYWEPVEMDEDTLDRYRNQF